MDKTALCRKWRCFVNNRIISGLPAMHPEPALTLPRSPFHAREMGLLKGQSLLPAVRLVNEYHGDLSTIACSE
jgi:hypothetical protein